MSSDANVPAPETATGVPATGTNRRNPRKRGRRRQVHLPVWKKTIYLAIVSGVALAIAEAILAAFGVRPLVERHDPYVGFSSYVPLFVERQKNGQTVMETAPAKRLHFNTQQFSAVKSPGTYRIFCLGGSTTYGRPYDDTTSFCGWLRAFLANADPARRWEVINAGGISYASYRVARVAQELARYEPDLLIIYTGNNEFLERRTYGNRTGPLLLVDQVSGLLSQLRTYTVLHTCLGASRSEPTVIGGDELPSEVVAILDQSVGPEVYRRDDALAADIANHFEHNLHRMITTARDAGAEVMLVVPAVNLRDCSPFRSEVSSHLTVLQRRDVYRALGRSRQRLDEGEHERAASEARQGLQVDARHAELHYLLGRALYADDQYNAAHEAFEAAVREDGCPLRATPVLRDLIRQAAAARGVVCVDFDVITRRASAHGVPGRDCFLDHVHPTIDANRRLALALLEQLIDAGIVRPRDGWGAEAIASVRKRVEGALDRRAHGVALRNLSKVLGWAGKREDAHRLALEAVELAPDDAPTQFQAGLVCEDIDSLDAAERFYRAALARDPSLTAATLNLGALLANQERYSEAQAVFEDGLATAPECRALWANLARAAEIQGDAPAAARYRARADRMGSDEALPNLARSHRGVQK